MVVSRLILGAAAYLSLAAASLHSPLSATGNCSRHDLDVLSCTPESLTTDACCVESPGGLLLLTQLYSKTAGGPADTWTMHGLWNDFCNGSYPSSCDDTRNYKDIASTLEEHRQYSLLDYMKENWRNDPVITTANGTDEELWEHEWSKHGTCMTTLRPSCYSHYSPQLELIQFLQEVVHLHKQLPTEDYLASCGIVPASNTTYALHEWLLE
ncbi:putative ribonuclease t2 protein [Neofusicoccum parvum UCRNP2]|uniref:ribonuclease T2 n=1 Tax=Botryosphaeria parva (strain UCR-NP2) TaxID=1287680 RepID=R1ERG2_BOTPV|nr:putative ribonuclease t2 protein [Neofusicoccum parvum UCRNP2]